MDRGKRVFQNHRRRLGLILAAGALLRLLFLDWGIPDARHAYPFHADEEACVETVLYHPPQGKLFQTTQYGIITGTGYFYAGKAAVALAEKIGLIRLDLSEKPGSLTMWQRLYLLLRLLTVAFSIGTILLVYLAGKNWQGRGAGELAALFIALEPVSVINAHYVKSDSAVTFFIMLTLYLALRSQESRAYLYMAGFAAGLAAATKYTGALVLAPVIAAPFLFNSTARCRKSQYAALAIPFFILGFAMLSPAVFFYFDQFANDFRRFPLLEPGGPSCQKIFFHLWQYPLLFARANGTLITLSFIFALFKSLRRRQKQDWLLFCWLLPYSILVLSFSEFFLRYSVPMMPILSLLLAGAVPGKYRTTFSFILAILLIGPSMVHLGSMARKHPRIQAQEWIEKNIPLRSSIALTMKYPNDHFFHVPLSSRNYRVHPLNLRKDMDVSSYLEGPFSYLAANELAWSKTAPDQHPSHEKFWQELNQSGKWNLLKTFQNRPPYMGPVFMKGQLPPDMYYLYQEIRIYQRR
jgi:hypothetical protein